MRRLRGFHRHDSYDIQIEPRNDATAAYECRVTRADGRQRSLRVRVVSRAGDRWTLDVDGFIQDLVISRYHGRILIDWRNRNYRLALQDPRDRPSPATEALEEESRLIVAPMAGRVVSVEKGPGDKVAAGESLAALEAMKMLNQIKAPRAGVIRRRAIEPGQSVKAGEALFELE
jgi:acetyl/propionyl-CoA carboxylase alpha subunit